jgi:hypothetical protein
VLSRTEDKVSESQTVPDHEQSDAEDEGDGFWVVTVIAGLVSLPFVALNWWQASSTGLIERLAAQAGADVPAVSPVLFNMNRAGLTPVIALLVDLIVFVGMLVLARRYWVGLMFVPALAYLGFSVLYYLVKVVPLLNSITLTR